MIDFLELPRYIDNFSDEWKEEEEKKQGSTSTKGGRKREKKGDTMERRVNINRLWHEGNGRQERAILVETE